MPDAPSTDSIEKQLCIEFDTLMSLPAGTVNTQTDLPGLGVDSLRFVSLVLTIEQKFGVNLMKIGLKPEDLFTVRAMAAKIKSGIEG